MQIIDDKLIADLTDEDLKQLGLFTFDSQAYVDAKLVRQEANLPENIKAQEQALGSSLVENIQDVPPPDAKKTAVEKKTANMSWHPAFMTKKQDAADDERRRHLYRL